jgi:hypothetical protein
MDLSGNTIGTVCNKTEKEMEASYANPCTYYKLGEAYCWYIDSSTFITQKPEGYINYLLKCNNRISAVKVPCDYCQTWYTRQKKTYKPNNLSFYSSIATHRLCGDTVKTLYHGRQIILRENTDSLITLQFSNTGYFWACHWIWKPQLSWCFLPNYDATLLLTYIPDKIPELAGQTSLWNAAKIYYPGKKEIDKL